MEKIFIGGAGVAAILMLLLRRKKYNFSYKVLIYMVLGPGVIGYFGAAFASKLAFNEWSGYRFYGKPLFLLLGTYLNSRLYKKNIEAYVNYYMPADLAALIVMKIGCLTTGCCAGIQVKFSESLSFQFPSQIIELIFSCFLLILMLYMEHKNLENRCRYYYYMIIYGISRFVFECLRLSKGFMIDLHIMKLSVGHVFCIATIVVGIVMIAKLHKQESARQVGTE